MAGMLRGRLRHSHLQNTYLQDPALVSELVLQEKNGIPFWESTLKQLEQLLAELSNPRRGFSPAYLVSDAECGAGESGDLVRPLRPLRSLTEGQRAELEDRLVEIYSEQFQLANRVSELKSVGSEFRIALTNFVEVAIKNDLDPDLNRDLARVSQALLETLGTLPEGIWLPAFVEKM